MIDSGRTVEARTGGPRGSDGVGGTGSDPPHTDGGDEVDLPDDAQACTVTPEHPFWEPTEETWTLACD